MSYYKKTNFPVKILLFFLILSCLAVSRLSLAESTGNYSINQQTSSEGSKTTGYFLVTQPSLNKKKVESLLKKMRTNVPRAEIRKKIEDKVMYRLVTECFDSMPPAKKKQAQLFKSSRTPFIVKSNNTFCVVASSQMTIQGAFAEQRELAAKHVDANIVRVSLPLTQWQVKSRDVYDLRDAVRMANAVTMKGMPTTIEPLNTDQ